MFYRIVLRITWYLGFKGRWWDWEEKGTWCSWFRRGQSLASSTWCRGSHEDSPDEMLDCCKLVNTRWTGWSWLLWVTAGDRQLTQVRARLQRSRLCEGRVSKRVTSNATTDTPWWQIEYVTRSHWVPIWMPTQGQMIVLAASKCS